MCSPACLKYTLAIQSFCFLLAIVQGARLSRQLTAGDPPAVVSARQVNSRLASIVSSVGFIIWVVVAHVAYLWE